MFHRALIIFIILLFVPNWQASLRAQGKAVFTQEQSIRLTPGFAKQCAAEIAGVMSYALRNGMPSAEKMGDLDYWVGFPKERVQSAYNNARPGFEEINTEYWRPINRYFYCQAGYVLAHWDDVASGSGSTTRPNVAVKTAPKAAAPVEKLPPARPAKMAPWSPNAMATDPEQMLSSKYAAERADALAACSASFNEMMKKYPAANRIEQVLSFESAVLEDDILNLSRDQIVTRIANLDTWIVTQTDPAKLSEQHFGKCLLQRRLAQLEGAPLATGAVDGTLTPLSIGSPGTPWKQQGKDARIIASDGKSAMDCVKLVELSKGDSKLSGVGGRVLSNQCSGPVEITWCYSPGDCDPGRVGNSWTVRSGGSWPVSAEKNVRWAACHGANTASFVEGSSGLRYYCRAPAKK